MKPRTLDGRVALVTGASRGLGKAIALSLGSFGARLALVSRDIAALNAVAEQARSSGVEAETFQADIVDETQVRRAQDEILSRFAHVDMLVNNAGTNARKPMEEFSLQEWNTILATTSPVHS